MPTAADGQRNTLIFSSVVHVIYVHRNEKHWPQLSEMLNTYITYSEEYMAKSQIMARAHYMTPGQKTKLGQAPRWHLNCKRLLAIYNKDGDKIANGPARPGKTAQDRARRGR